MLSLDLCMEQEGAPSQQAHLPFGGSHCLNLSAPVQEQPLSQQVEPDHVVPPHCPYAFTGSVHGAGGGGGPGGVGGPGGGVGPSPMVKSKHEMKLSGGDLHGWFTHDCPVLAFTTFAKSELVNFSVERPMLLTSLHEFPVFQTHRATP